MTPLTPRLVASMTVSAVALATLLAGCASSTDTTSATQAAASQTGTEETHYPLTITNCGVSVTIAAEPQRVVTVKSSTAEMMLALGVQSKIVGAAYLDGPLPDSLADRTVPALTSPLSDKVPGQESVLALEPDLIYAGWESNVSAKGIGDRAELAKLGIATYVPPPACQGENQPDPLTFDDVFASIREAGQIFNAAAAADSLVSAERAALAKVVKDGRDLRALWWSSGTDTPFVGGAIGAPELIMEAAGLQNIVTEKASWASFAWENVAAADPDVIVLVDSTWNSAEKKKAYLASNPVTKELSAVKEGRYIVVPFAATEAGVRTVDATVSIADQLGALSVDSPDATPADGQE
ncbi:putative F420-0 ABC transporter substrate-binding protein [Rarobacter incanus]|uniref:Iron complex transport system substrate-binding protein n=1 Tax=Rarobacter incanus TaxID=153494 RepID=A0A542SR09_9MICO|nr:putative F420-0 ABC transporter substrate-binding protein [Rarobacter incanus]TQK77034.1 iron complex transport system substrate-binding protein [Rarobacter incanus]